MIYEFGRIGKEHAADHARRASPLSWARHRSMTKFSLPRPLRLAFLWGAAFSLVLALRFESHYRDTVAHLPSLVDERGTTASVQVAMAGLDSYERARQIRRFGFISFGTGVLFCVGWLGTKSRGNELHAD